MRFPPGRDSRSSTWFRIVPHDTVGNPIFVLTSPVGSYRLPNVYELDLRLANTFTIGPVSVTPSLNVFNATNANTVLSRRGLTGTYNSARDVPFIQDPRFNADQRLRKPAHLPGRDPDRVLANRREVALIAGVAGGSLPAPFCRGGLYAGLRPAFATASQRFALLFGGSNSAI